MSLLAVLPMLAGEIITVSGVVVDAATQEPLIGATILVKGTSNGTATSTFSTLSPSIPI